MSHYSSIIHSLHYTRTRGYGGKEENVYGWNDLKGQVGESVSQSVSQSIRPSVSNPLLSVLLSLCFSPLLEVMDIEGAVCPPPILLRCLEFNADKEVVRRATLS